MTKILIPVDFSEISNNALDYGIGLANTLEADITLLHSVSFPATDPLAPAYDRSGGDLEENYQEKAARESLDELAERVSKATDKEVNVDSVLPMGFPGDEILNVLKEHDHDIVIMGTKGSSNFPDSMLGTTSSNVIQKASCSVLLVPENAKFAPIKKICFASDHHEGDMEALERLVALGDRMKAEVHSLHVIDDPIEGISKDNLAQDLFRKTDIRDKVQLHRESTRKGEKMEDTIDRFVAAQQIDLLAMLNQNRNFFQRLFDSSFSRKMAFHSKVPLLVFHQKEGGK